MKNLVIFITKINLRCKLNTFENIRKKIRKMKYDLY